MECNNNGYKSSLKTSRLTEASESDLMTDTILCKRCKKDKTKLAKPPFRNELGGTIYGQICSGCWDEWLTHQTLLINHYGLDPRDSKSKEFLYQQIESVLLNDKDGQDIDTSQKGDIEW